MSESRSPAGIMAKLENTPEIVCLCGSTKFKRQYREENRRLSENGKIVLSVSFFPHADNIELKNEKKEMLDKLHKRKIDIADRIHVINVNGYIGESTSSEIEYAKKTDTEVTYFDNMNIQDRV